jgi:hypothetical protein
MNYPKTLPETHKQLLDKIITTLKKDQRILGIGARARA